MLVKRAVPAMLALVLLLGIAGQAVAQSASLMRGALFQGAGQPLLQAGRPLFQGAGQPLIQGAGQPLFQGAGQPLLQAGRPLIQGAGQPLIQVRAVVSDPSPAAGGGSLFAGREGASLFAPFGPRRARAEGATADAARAGHAGLGGAGLRGMALVRALIGQAEAGSKGYDAVQYGARIKPAKPPTQMTIQEIYDWIAATPGQPHAIGYYQFIPSTLSRLVAELGVTAEQVFSPQLQDRLADILLAEAGLHALGRGEIDRHTFMNNMAKIWAGLPNATGKSHYDGYAGNRAALSWEYFDRQMAQAFPS